MKSNKVCVESSKIASAYEMYMLGETLEDLAKSYGMDKGQLKEMVKTYKNNSANPLERDADIDDLVAFKLQGVKIRGKVLKRYDNSVLVEFSDKYYRNSKSLVDLAYYGGRTVISDRDYRIIER